MSGKEVYEILEKKEVKEIHRAHRNRNAFSMWWLGMINNFHYTLVLSGSASIAEGYEMKKYVALITWANVFFGIVARVVNAFVLSYLSFNIRVTATSLMGVVAVLLVSFAWDIGGHVNVAAFIVMLIGVVFIGVASSYGEAVFLGYMERMPSMQIGAWSSGTGLSGVAASLIYLGLTSAGLSNSQIFLISIPVVAVYWLLYFFGLKLPFYTPVNLAEPAEQIARERSQGDGGYDGYVYKAMVNWKGTSWSSIVPEKSGEKPECLKAISCDAHKLGDAGIEDVSEGVDAVSQLGRWARWKRDVWPMVKEMHSFTLWNNFNLAAVYVAEYAVQFMAPFSFPCNEAIMRDSFWLKNSFVISQFWYQIGVLISRSSLVCIRIRHVWILTVIQVLNAIAWFLQAKLKYMSDPNDAGRELNFAFGLFAWMIFVGLMGGASYVNVFYNILEETRELQETEESEAIQRILARRREGSDVSRGEVEGEAHKTEVAGVGQDETHEACRYIESVWKGKRDMAMNIGALYATVGITLGSLLDLLFTLVVLKSDECL